MPSAPPLPEIEAFIARWSGTAQAERANYARFLDELCPIIEVPKPDPATGAGGDYRYERGVAHREADGSKSNRRIDLYKRGCFVLEAKQSGAAPKQTPLFALGEADRRAGIRRSPGWAQAMLKAKGQAEGYARDLPAEEGWPPFVIVCDIGFCFDIYADFTGTGKHYAQFPDRENFRLYLDDLRRPEMRARLRAIWTEPLALDPSRERVRVTRDIAAFLALLVKALETRHAPQPVAIFLMRCIFSMFAQSVGLLPSPTSFTELLEDCRKDPKAFLVLVGDLWRHMNAGGYSSAMHATVRRFNGGLFAPGPHGAAEPLPVDADMLQLLIEASRRDWADVEPAIFGSLLENALEKQERSELGAHFTPRAFVERLVLPTVMEPLRLDWDGVKVAAVKLADEDNKKAAAAELRGFHAKLCATRVLDPACGTGNFLYVTLELMKRLEGEVLDFLADIEGIEGDRLDVAGVSVDPHQFLGIEKNPRAVPVAELVLWIGYLQWHFRTRGNAPPAEPILRDFKNIREGDALLTYAREEPERDDKGRPITRWGGQTKPHPVTGEMVPDEADQIPILRPVDPKPSLWPEAEFIIGNPPFIGAKKLRDELGDGYAEALWKAYPKVPKSADIALHFWWKAAQALLGGKLVKGKAAGLVTQRFGFITSNSIRQVFCRRVVADALGGETPLHLAYAIPDHPWVGGADTAAVRIALTVAEVGHGKGTLARVVTEAPGSDGVPLVVISEEYGHINADLTLGLSGSHVKALRAGEGLASPGIKLHGAGFIVNPAQAAALGLGKTDGLEFHIRPYLNGRDLQQNSRGMMVIDTFDLSEKDLRQRFPSVYQHLVLHVKPERNTNNRSSYRDQWWLFGEPRRELRPALSGLRRFIATPITSKHRVFSFLSAEILPDDALLAVASSDAFLLGVLSSKYHTSWCAVSAGFLGKTPRYIKADCFDPFPFPDATQSQRAAIAEIAEDLDAHRKARLAAHPHLTLTALYNCLEALRVNRKLTDAERDIHDAGQVSILREYHDKLDEAVAAAYGWPANLPEADIIARLVALNAQRVAEEARGQIRWLRPEFQAPRDTRRAVQAEMAVDGAGADTTRQWPKEAPAQYVALRAALRGPPASARDIARRFQGAPRRADQLEAMLQNLVALGQARHLEDGRYTA